MKKKLLLLSLGVSALALGVIAMTHPMQMLKTEALNETVGSFTVVDGNDYTVNGSEISTTSGKFVAEHSTITNNYRLRIVAQPSKQNSAGDYGIIFNGSYVDGKLSGDSAKIWYAPGANDWRVTIGYYVDNVYTNVGEMWCDFYDGSAKTFDFFQNNGEVAIRMNNWYIGNYHETFSEGNIYVFSDGTPISYSDLSVTQLTRSFGNYSYRYGWGGANFYEMCDCFPQGHSFSYTMRLPDAVNKAQVEALYLHRTTWWDPNQNMTVVLNEEALADWPSVPFKDGGIFTDDYYAIPLTKMPNDGVFNFTLTPTAGTSVNGHFKLMYKLGGQLYCADSLTLGSPLSESNHNYDKSGVDYHGFQKHWMGMRDQGSFALVGNKPMAPIKRVAAPELITGNAVNIVMANSTPVTVNFEDYQNMPMPDGFEPQRIELWWPDVFVGNTHSYTFENQNFSSTYYSDYWFDEMDESCGGWLKVSATNTINVTAAVGHTITFHSIGGISVEPQVKYGNEVTVEPTAPVLARHSFVGWFTASEGGTQFVFGSELAADIDLYARWTLSDKSAVTAFAQKILDDTYDFSKKSQAEKEAAWSGVAESWNALFEDEKAYFNNNPDNVEVITQAQERYACIVGRNYVNINDFMVSPLPSMHINSPINTNLAMMIVLIASATIITALAAAFIVLKKKQRR